MKTVSDVGSHLFTILMASKYGMHLGQFLATSCAACGIPPAVDLSHQHVAEWPCAKLCLQGRTQEFVLEGASTPQTHCWSDFQDRPTWTHNMCGQSYAHLHINRHVSYIYSDTATAFYYQIISLYSDTATAFYYQIISLQNNNITEAQQANAIQDSLLWGAWLLTGPHRTAPDRTGPHRVKLADAMFCWTWTESAQRCCHRVSKVLCQVLHKGYLFIQVCLAGLSTWNCNININIYINWNKCWRLSTIPPIWIIFFIFISWCWACWSLYGRINANSI